MNTPSGSKARTVLGALRDEGGDLGLALGLGLFAGLLGAWGLRALINDSLSRQEPPPHVNVSVTRPVPQPPTDRDPRCVENAYEAQSLVYKPRGDPTKFEGAGAMWSVPNVHQPLYRQREVEAIVRARLVDAERRWNECRGRTPEQPQIPEQPPPVVDRRDYFTGTYRLENWRRTVSTERCTFDPSSQGNPLMRVESLGGVNGVRLSFPAQQGFQLDASFAADTFRATRPLEILGDQQTLEIGGSFYERSDRTVIEDGYVKLTTGSVVDCEMSYQGVRV